MGKIQIRKTREKKKAKIWATQIENNQEKPKLETQPEMQWPKPTPETLTRIANKARNPCQNTNTNTETHTKHKHSPKSTLKHKHKCQNRNTNVENGSAMEA